jgi:hypothetical protein
MNITLSADEALIAKARKRLLQSGVSLNQFVREQLLRAAQEPGSGAAEEFLTLVREHPGKSEPGWRFDRNESHSR